MERERVAAAQKNSRVIPEPYQSIQARLYRLKSLTAFYSLFCHSVRHFPAQFVRDFGTYNNLVARRATVSMFLSMPSFDIVSNVNSMEIENAVNQAKKELASRFDFKDSKAEIVLEKNEIKLSAEDQFKIRALSEIVMGKLSKRNISLKNIDRKDPDVSPLGHARQVIVIKQGLESTVAKQVTGFIRDGKFKVTTQIQGEEVRVTGKSRDELQAVIGAVRAHEFPVAVQFVNFRD